MGRASECVCTCGNASYAAKALLEAGELKLRSGKPGEGRRRIPLLEITGVKAKDAVLSFVAGRDRIELRFPQEIAVVWAEKIAAPPMTLASKLGITPETKVCCWGEPMSEELREVSAAGLPGSLKDCQVVLAEVAWDQDVAKFLSLLRNSVGPDVPFWIVYRKGKGDGVKEGTVRELARDAGYLDTKVARVSATHTGLRFIRKRPAV